MTDDLIARLRGPRTAQGGLWPIPNLHDESADALQAKDARIAALVAALKPFADAAEDLDDTDADRYAIWEHGASMNITIGDLRAARAAVGETE